MIGNSRNLIMKFELFGLILRILIYNSRNLLMKFELDNTILDLSSTTVEIY